LLSDGLELGLVVFRVQGRNRAWALLCSWIGLKSRVGLMLDHFFSDRPHDDKYTYLYRKIVNR